MPPLLIIAGLFFIFFTLFLPVSSDNTTTVPAVCPVPSSPLLSAGIQQHPTCSLSSRPADPPPEFLSFEEWKAKQLAEQDASNREKESHAPSVAQPMVTQNANASNEVARKSKRRNHTEQSAISEENIKPSTSESQQEFTAYSSPRSHIPLMDRFNYASNECNARIHSSHKSAKSASSILSRKKDRYMLSPCQTSKEKQFVIVELCEDIRIDTIQLANFEFFSGIFKDFRVSVAHAYTSDGKGWVIVGDYAAKNVRGVQSFHPIKELLPFYRYIRVDFLSYYGTEYFCPVSLLRVYGLTQMEEWKSDVWKAEWEASQAPAENISPPDQTVILLEGRPSASNLHDTTPDLNAQAWSQKSVKDTQTTSVESGENLIQDEISVSSVIVTPTTVPEVLAASTLSSSTHETIKEAAAAKITSESTSGDSSQSPELSTGQGASQEGGPAVEAELLRSPQSTEADQSTTTMAESRSQVTSMGIPMTTAPAAPVVSASIPPLPSANAGIANSTRQRTITQTVSTTIILSAATPSPSAAVPNGESVYRMIINRLIALEGNQTLYAKYVEEQGRMVNGRLERMEEDIGRLGGIVTLQQQNVAKMLEIHRAEMDSKYGKLISRVDHLAHEVLMEKRLGVAQLLLLVTVLVFMGLTRGSRGEPMRLSRASAAWNKGIQSSGEWVSGWRGSRISVPDDAAVVHPRNASSPTLSLRRSSSVRMDPERRLRHTSSQRAQAYGTNYEEFYQTPPRLSRHPTRSRHNSQQSRSRNHTPTRPPLLLPGPTDTERSYGMESNRPLGAAGTTATGTGHSQQQGHKRTNSGGTGGYWRAGRSISLSSAKGLSGGLSFGKPVGSTKRLAKTAHMHEVKPLRSATLDVPSSKMANEQAAGQSLSVLSPMMEDPHSAGLFGYGDAAPRGSGAKPVRIGGFNAELSTAQSEGALSETFGPVVAASSSFGMDSNSGQNSGLGIPFPSPALDLDGEGDDDVWVDDSGDGEPYVQELGMPSSPTRVKRGSGFAFGSPRRPFVFASSPPGKTRIKKRSDIGSPITRGEGP